MQGNWLAHTPLVLQNERPCPLPAGDKDSRGGGGCHMTHMLKQNRGAHIESETGKDSPAQAVRTLYLWEGGVQARDPFFSGCVGEEGLHAGGSLSQLCATELFTHFTNLENFPKCIRYIFKNFKLIRVVNRALNMSLLTINFQERRYGMHCFPHLFYHTILVWEEES